MLALIVRCLVCIDSASMRIFVAQDNLDAELSATDILVDEIVFFAVRS